jgi:MFS family permease
MIRFERMACFPIPIPFLRKDSPMGSGADRVSDPDRLTMRAGFGRLVGDSRFLTVMLVATTAPMSVALVSPALPVMATNFGVSDAEVGLVVTAITLPAMFIAPIVGIASDMYGRRPLAIAGLGLFGVAGVAITLTNDFSLVLGLRGLQGVAMAAIAPMSITLLGDLYSGSLGTIAQGFRSSVAGVSVTLIPILAGWLAGLAWEYPFYLYAFAFVGMGAVYWILPETAPGVNEVESVGRSLGEYWESVGDELRDVGLVVVMFGGFLRFFTVFGYITFVPIFAVRTMGATPFEAGVVVAMRGIRIPLNPLAGYWVDRFSRKTTLLASLAVLCTSFTLIPFAPGIWWLGGLALLTGVGDSAIDPVVNDAVSIKVSPDNRNGVVGALRVLKEAGKTAAPLFLGGVLVVGGYTPLFLVVAGVTALYALAVVLALERSW